MSKKQKSSSKQNQKDDMVLSAGNIVRRDFPLNSNIVRLVDVLDSQIKTGIKNHDWDAVEYSFTKHDDGDVCISINSDDVGFCFNGRGRFKYIFNWKE